MGHESLGKSAETSVNAKPVSLAYGARAAIQAEVGVVMKFIPEDIVV
jgi:hypothetical protein